ncbi:MAG: hypothetical protein JSS78_04385 [Bacteroidetes bacterium]|nr:hypothetical protein [Bacteroidota bacterium]
MRQSFICIFLCAGSFCLVSPLFAQTPKDDIYTNKNPRDYYEDRDHHSVNDDYPEEDLNISNERGNDRTLNRDYAYEENVRNQSADNDVVVCRRGHHYKCRHDRAYQDTHYYWFPGGGVTVNTGRHGSIRSKVWIPGHWEYSSRGRRFWVPGHHSRQNVDW